MFVGVKMIVLVCKQVLKTFFSQLNTIFGFLRASNLTSTIYFSNACMQLYMDNESCVITPSNITSVQVQWRKLMTNIKIASIC